MSEKAELTRQSMSISSEFFRRDRSLIEVMQEVYMSKLIQAIELAQLKDKKIPDFKPGDAVAVQIKVKEGDRERLQLFEGDVIAVRKRGLHSAFTVRKISHGEGVERVFQTHSPLVHSIKVLRHGNVRRAKLYFLRELQGKKARIKEKVAENNESATDQPIS